VPVLFIAVVLASGFSGELVARFYSEPMNRWLREYWGDASDRLASRLGARPEPGKNSSTPHPDSH
jgi:hypothetical protein